MRPHFWVLVSTFVVFSPLLDKIMTALCVRVEPTNWSDVACGTTVSLECYNIVVHEHACKELRIIHSFSVHFIYILCHYFDTQRVFSHSASLCTSFFFLCSEHALHLAVKRLFLPHFLHFSPYIGHLSLVFSCDFPQYLQSTVLLCLWLAVPWIAMNLSWDGFVDLLGELCCPAKLYACVKYQAFLPQ